MEKAVVTGIGLATPLGLGREKTWQALLNGQSAIARDPFIPDTLSARIPGLDVPPEIRLLSLGFLAAAEAVQDAGAFLPSFDPLRLGCTVSVSKPNIAGGSRIRFSETFLPSTTGEQIARVFKIGGPVQSIAAACATGANAAVIAARWVEQGICDLVLAGAVESSLHPLYEAGFYQMGVLAKGTVRPFDRRREGFAIGEGAGVLVIERKDHAMMRGARVYGELSGAMANDAGGVAAFNPGGASVAHAMAQTLSSMGLDAVDYINVHGTATRLNDLIETRAVKTVFGDRAKEIALSSTKAATGHLLGASGAVELAFCLLALRDNIVPPTLNLTEPDAECDLDYTPGKPRFMQVRSALSLSFGFGGQIGVVGVQKP